MKILNEIMRRIGEGLRRGRIVRGTSVSGSSRAPATAEGTTAGWQPIRLKVYTYYNGVYVLYGWLGIENNEFVLKAVRGRIVKDGKTIKRVRIEELPLKWISYWKFYKITGTGKKNRELADFVANYIRATSALYYSPFTDMGNLFKNCMLRVFKKYSKYHTIPEEEYSCFIGLVKEVQSLIREAKLVS